MPADIDHDRKRLQDAGGPLTIGGRAFEKNVWIHARKEMTLNDAIKCFTESDTVLKSIDELAMLRSWPWLATATWTFRRVNIARRSLSHDKPTELKHKMEALQKGTASVADILDDLNKNLATNMVDASTSVKSILAEFLGTGLMNIRKMQPYHSALEVESFMIIHGFIAELRMVSGLAQAFSMVKSDKNGRGPVLAGVDQFVTVLASLWLATMGKKASAASSVSSRGDDPPFVRFCKRASAHAGVTGLSRTMIKTALKNSPLTESG